MAESSSVCPQYLIFCNGREDQPDELELKLSDAFVPPLKDGESPALECRVRMLNINLGHNRQLMQDCRRLWEYAKFVNEVNRNLDSGYPIDRAVNTAIDTCIQQDILKDLLIQSRSEVLLMFLTEYDEKLHMEHTFEEGREAGMEQGRRLGLEQGQKLGLEQGQKLGLEQGQKFGFEQGQRLGLEQGQKLGQEQILFLTQKLLAEGRLEDLKKASSDEQYREILLKKFQSDHHKDC